MCGITGFYALKNDANIYLTKIEQSTNKLLLRGPDNKRFTNEGCIALGHTRLSIIDTTMNASQPMADHTGRYQLIFNGEIFNFKELSRQYLDQVWERFDGPRTASDTEVLLYLLIEYGPKCLGWLSGFFAFAFYDKEKEVLMLARDRFGKKPLVYYSCESYFAFASEMKALFAWDIPRRINYNTLRQYLQLSYVPQSESMLEGVQKVQPGTYMLVSKSGQETGIYYEIKINQKEYGRYSYMEAQQELVRLLDLSVQERLISDVPLGAFLSGGIDSSAIVALASRHTNQLNTFSVGYKDNAFFDETSYALLVAKMYQTNHTVFSLSNSDFLEHVYGVLDYIDEPFADSSAIPTYILSKYTRQQVTVALSGDGGDEVFSGYHKHGAEWKARQHSVLNEVVKAGLPLWKILPQGRNNKITNLFRQLRRFAEGARLPVRDRYWNWALMNAAPDANRLLSETVRAKISSDELQKRKDLLLAPITSGDFNEILLADMKLVLPGDMLVKVDLMSMANSLEVRCPFLDYKVVDFAFSLPASYKIDGSLKKKVLQDAFRDLLPSALYNRPKHGFEIPLLGWLRNELWGLIDNDLLRKDFVTEQGIFNPEAVEALKKKLHSSNPENSHSLVWALIVFQYWWKRFYV